jgi:hypothetical protein
MPAPADKPDKIRVSGSRVIDPASGIDAELDLFIAAGRIAAIGNSPDGFSPAASAARRDRQAGQEYRSDPDPREVY